ncbi:MAG: ATP-grasp fold amidoligase family protein, partial [Gaiellaceae bacterium]
MTGAVRARAVTLGGRIVKSRPFPSRARRAILEWKWSHDGRRALAVPRRPKTFNEKVRFKMTSDRRPLLATLSDKVATREYVARVVGPDVLTEVYLVTDDPEEVRRESLPREVAVKAAHGSGGCVLIAESAPRQRTLPESPAGWGRFLVHPESVDWGRLQGLCGEWLARRYGFWEWGYRDLPGRILAEELLQDAGAVPTDFKLFTFHGKVR